MEVDPRILKLQWPPRVGPHSCDDAMIDAGAAGQVDCSGNCAGATILQSQTVLCTNDFACSGVSIPALSNDGTVLCSGFNGCINAEIMPEEGGSIFVECSGIESCSVAEIDTGVDGYVVCSGDDACHGNSLYAYATIIKSKCLLCSPGSCDQPCDYRPPGWGGGDCIDGAENGDCNGLTVPIVPVGQSTTTPILSNDSPITTENPSSGQQRHRTWSLFTLLCVVVGVLFLLNN